MPSPDAPRDRRATAIAWALYVTLTAAVVLWALLIWHPWIDWFGRRSV